MGVVFGIRRGLSRLGRFRAKRALFPDNSLAFGSRIFNQAFTLRRVKAAGKAAAKPLVKGTILDLRQ